MESQIMIQEDLHWFLFFIFSEHTSSGMLMYKWSKCIYLSACLGSISSTSLAMLFLPLMQKDPLFLFFIIIFFLLHFLSYETAHKPPKNRITLVTCRRLSSELSLKIRTKGLRENECISNSEGSPRLSSHFPLIPFFRK